MIETSILFGHYSEDKQREDIARRCLQAVAKQRNETTELVLIMNGIYPYRDEFAQYADQWDERPADIFPGRTCNIGMRLARGKIFFMLSNDCLVDDGAVAECVRLIKLYPQYLVSPMFPRRSKRHMNVKLPEGFIGNPRGGDNAVCMTRRQAEDVGWHDEVCCQVDEINYVNRRVAKGYTVLILNKTMATDIGGGAHSYQNQIKQYNLKEYNVRTPYYTREELLKQSFN